jgi:hypothetical protein
MVAMSPSTLKMIFKLTQSMPKVALAVLGVRLTLPLIGFSGQRALSPTKMADQQAFPRLEELEGVQSQFDMGVD